jgi:hypothetical protein
VILSQSKSSQPTIVTNLTPDQFAAKAAELKASQGIVLQGDSGTVSKMGVKAGWRYDGKVLTVTILSKPMFIGIDHVEQIFNNWITS